MTELIPQFMQLLGDALKIENSTDLRVISSLTLFWVSFPTALIFMYDIFRGKKRKIAGSVWHSAFISSAFMYFSIAVFALMRSLDAMADAAFLIENPRAITTLSQHSLFLEIPVFGVAFMILLTLVLHARIYLFKIKPHGNGKGAN